MSKALAGLARFPRLAGGVGLTTEMLPTKEEQVSVDQTAGVGPKQSRGLRGATAFVTNGIVAGGPTSKAHTPPSFNRSSSARWGWAAFFAGRGGTDVLASLLAVCSDR